MADKLTKNERRERAREQARQAREAEKRREKRNKLFLQGGIVLGVLAILGIVALVLTQTMKPAGPGPQNMASGGAVFTKDLEVVKTPALESGAERIPYETNRDELPIDVTVYVDYMCPACGNFEQTHGVMLENYVGSGDIELEVFPLNFLDPQSRGSKYSTRAANAFACLVEQQPEHAFKYHNTLLSPDVQPTEGGTGLTDDQLVEAAETVGAEATNEFKQCVKDVRFGSFISGNYKMVSETGIQGLAEGAQVVADTRSGELWPADGPQRLSSTPTVIVNGQQWVEGRDGSLEEYILKIKSELDKGSNGSEENDADADAEGADDTEADSSDSE